MMAHQGSKISHEAPHHRGRLPFQKHFKRWPKVQTGFRAFESGVRSDNAESPHWSAPPRELRLSLPVEISKIGNGASTTRRHAAWRCGRP